MVASIMEYAIQEQTVTAVHATAGIHAVWGPMVFLQTSRYVVLCVCAHNSPNKQKAYAAKPPMANKQSMLGSNVAERLS